MNREILFRGKRTDNGKWVEGSLHIERGETDKSGNRSIDYRILGMRGECTYVDPSTVGQYTGLKDGSGKRIFEGDIVVYPDSVSYSSYDDYNEGIVDYDEEAMRFYFTNRWSVEMEDFDVVDGMMVDVEVIGNIHDNPELIGGKMNNNKIKNESTVDIEKAMQFLEGYAFKDEKEIYTNGTTLVPLFRVKQAFVDKADNGFFEG